MDDVDLAERALVACVALEPRRVGEVAGWLSPADFRLPVAGLLYRRLLEVGASGARDPGALLDRLRAAGDLRGDGYPVSALLRWWDVTPTPGHVPVYGRVIVEAAAARCVEVAGVRLLQVSERGRAVPCVFAAHAQRAVLAAAVRRLSAVPGVVAATSPAPVVAGEPQGLVEVPPQVGEAERVVVGSLLLAPRSMAVVGRWLSPADFASPDLRAAYAAVGDLVDAGRAVDRVTVAAELHARDTSRVVDMLGDCEAAVPAVPMVGHYARVVVAASMVRQVRAAGAALVNLGRARAGGGVATVAGALARLDVLADPARRLRVAMAVTTSRPGAVSAPMAGRVVEVRAEVVS